MPHPLIVHLAEAAKRSDLNPYKLSKASGVNLSLVQRYLGGEVKGEQLEVVDRLATALGLDLKLVLKRKPKPAKKRTKKKG